MPENAGKKRWTLTKPYQRIKKFMLTDLSARGFDGAAYTDKIDEYMTFWVRLQELNADVDRRGITVRDARGSTVENRSVSLAIQVSRQMLAICTALGFRADTIRDAENVSDDDL